MEEDDRAGKRRNRGRNVLGPRSGFSGVPLCTLTPPPLTHPSVPPSLRPLYSKRTVRTYSEDGILETEGTRGIILGTVHQFDASLSISGGYYNNERKKRTTITASSVPGGSVIPSRRRYPRPPPPSLSALRLLVLFTVFRLRSLPGRNENALFSLLIGASIARRPSNGTSRVP